MRNLTKALAAVSLLAPASGYSLGIGEIKLHSALNQNLRAEIALVVSPQAGESVDGIRVRLAPPEKFDEAGVKWSYFLSKIKFTPIKKPNGTVVIKLSSTEPLREPFLDFLIEVNWPTGSLYREFTVLVDPPSTYSQPVVPVYKEMPAEVEKTEIVKTDSKSSIAKKETSKPKVDSFSATPSATTTTAYPIEVEPTNVALEPFITEEPAKETVISEKKVKLPKEPLADKSKTVTDTISKTANEKTVATEKSVSKKESSLALKDKDGAIKKTQAPVSVSTPKVAKEYGPVRKKATLYKIASEVNTYTDVSVEQMMLAIYNANPDAFYAKNVNALRAGQTLNIPSKDVILKVSRAEALNEFRQQNKRWKGVVSPVTEKTSVVKKTPRSTKLVLTAPEQSKVSSKTKVATSTKKTETSNKDAVKLANANEDLKLRLEKLQEQLEKVQQILVLKDKQLEILRKNLEAKSEADIEKIKKEKEKIAADLAKVEKAAQVAEADRLAAEKAAAEKVAAEKVAAEKVAAEKAAAEKAAAEQTAAEKAAAEKVAAEKAAAEKAAAEKAAAEQTAAEKAAAEKVAAEKAAAEKAAAEKEAAEIESLDVETAKIKLAELEAKMAADSEAKATADLQAAAKAEENNKKLAQLEAKESKNQADLDEIAALKAEIQEDTDAKVQSELEAKALSEANAAKMEKLKAIISPVSKAEVDQQTTPPAPVKPSAPTQIPEKSIFDDPYYLGMAGGGALFLGLLGWMLWRKRKVQGTTEVESMFTESSEINLPNDDDDEFGVESLDDNSSFMFGGESSFLSDDNDFDAFEVEQDEVDPISEADVYLAYGRYQQAEELMRQAIEDQPDRDECKFKLLEILAANEDKEGFEKYLQELADAGKSSDGVFWSKVTEMGQEIVPDSPLLSGADSGSVSTGSVELSKEGDEEEHFKPDLSMFDEVDDTANEQEESSHSSNDEVTEINVDVSLFDSDEDNDEGSDSLLEESQFVAASTGVDMSVFDDEIHEDIAQEETAEEDSAQVPEENNLSMFDDGSLDSFVSSHADENAVKSDEEIETAVISEEQETADNEMDFDLSGVEEAPTVVAEEQEPAGNEMDFDLSGFEEEAPAAATAEEQEPAGNEMDFDLSGFEEEAPAAATAEEQEPAGNEMDFDLSGFEEKTPAAEEQEAAENEEMDFDLSDFEEEAPTAVTEEGQESLENEEMDFDLSDFEEEAPTAAAEEGQEAAENEEIDFDLSDFEEEAPAAVAEERKESLENEEMDFDLSDFEENESTSLEPAADDEVEFDLSDFEDDTETTLDISADDETEFDLSDFEDDAETSLDLSADDETEFDLSDFEGDGEIDLDISLENEADFDLSAFEGSSSSGEMDASSEFVGLENMNSLDTKIDLARAYIDVGDSNAAKAIIEQILEEGTDEQKMIAQELKDSL